MMRAVRFSAQLGFAIEEKTAAAVEILKENLRSVSAERIQTELIKLLVSKHPEYLRTAWEQGITGIVLPEFDACMATPQNTPHHQYNVGEHTLCALQNIRADKVLRLTMLLHDIAKPVVRKTDENGRDHFKTHGHVGVDMATAIMRRLKLDNDTIKKVSTLVRWHDHRPEPTEASVRRAIWKIGEELFPLYLEVQRADLLAQSTYYREEKLARLDGVIACYEQIERNKDCVSLKTLAVKGSDLIAAGQKPGPQLGEQLDRLLQHVLEHPEDNQKEILLGLL